jgi:hypothetical protein
MPFFRHIKTVYAGKVAGVVQVCAGLKFLAAGSCFIMHRPSETVVFALDSAVGNLIII